MSVFVYSAEHEKWVLDNKDRYSSYEVIASDFNERFGTTKSVNAIQQFLTKKLGVGLVTEKTGKHYTAEEELWLIENYHSHESYDALTNQLNSTFGKAHSKESVREKCSKSLGLIGMPNHSKFKDGNIQKQCPIGTVREHANGAYIKMMDSRNSHQSGYREPYWLPIQKKIWMDYNGKVPEGKMVVFLDGNRKNLDIDNLYCIDRRISALIASNGWYSEDREITLSAIKYCELYLALKEQRGGC